MPTWMLLFSVIEFFSLPIIGLVALSLSKFTEGPTARIAERWFLGVLLAVTLITCRTVIVLGPCWFAHTATLGLMIVGSMYFPDRESIVRKRIVGQWH